MRLPTKTQHLPAQPNATLRVSGLAWLGRYRRLALLGLLGLLGLGSSLQALARAIVVRDDRGVEHRLAAPPQRIVSLLPSLTEIAAVLGVGTRLVGVDRYSNWPAEVATLPRLGGLDDAQIEAIVRLKPDVVLASKSARVLDKLDELGITVVRLKSDSHADVKRSLDVVAQLLGKPDAGAAVWARLERELTTAAARVPVRARGQTVYFELGGGPYAAGASSFIGEVLERLGMQNVVPAELGPFPKLNPEFVVRARPDWIMGSQREQAALASRPGWQTLPAVQQRQLCGFTAQHYEMMTRPGPRMGETAALLADCLSGQGRQSAP